ncbi:DNA-processing protein DprA [Patescibacteria group bacterium]
MTYQELLQLVALARLDIQGHSVIPVVQHIGSVHDAFESNARALRTAGAQPKLIKAIHTIARHGNLTDEKELLEIHDVTAIPWTDDRYPCALRDIPDKPAVIFTRGDLSPLSQPTFAVVGTRKMTRYGESVTRDLVRSLTSAGATIVSGLALGIDAVAHGAALESHGKTVAILGSGIDTPTVGPRQNVPIAAHILASGGALISEYPPTVPGAKHRFPQRNRIIAGVARATAVIQAPARSGALITARACLEYGRDVFAIPGPITEAAHTGSNALIASGAIPICEIHDMRDYYGLMDTKPVQLRSFSVQEHAILNALEEGVQTIDGLAKYTALDATVILSLLTILELDTIVSRVGERFRMIDKRIRSPLP